MTDETPPRRPPTPPDPSADPSAVPPAAAEPPAQPVPSPAEPAAETPAATPGVALPPDELLERMLREIEDPTADARENAESREALAGEYVLGTLTARERDVAHALIEDDPAFAASVGQWEGRLGELHAMVGAVDPPPAVWNAIKAGLPNAAPRGFLRLPALPRPRPLPTNVVDLTKRLARWRSIATGTGAMAAVLALFILTSAVAPTLLPDSLRPRPRVIVQTAESSGSPPPRYVAVLQKDAASPAFIVTVDIAERNLTVRRVAAERTAGKSYELWLVSNKFPAPRSLGLVSGGEFTRAATLAAYDPATIEDASFAVSLEPEGGSPNGAPSNVMFLGKLVEATPPETPR
jgi:anti-sigma-K factor RskA